MPTAEELLQHSHPVIDSDSHFVIDAVTREIKNVSGKTKLVQYDHNSERYTFSLPRYIEGHDMSLCNVAKVDYFNVSSDARQQKYGRYDIEDLQISQEDESHVTCSWLISSNATQLYGTLNFSLCFECTADEETVYTWGTEIYTGIKVSKRNNNGEAIAEKYADILEQWRQELFYGSGSGSSSGTVVITDDGDGNITINSGISVTDDGDGNISIA